ncbi:ubiquitin carboxyl-terminal hydrolase [Babesia ovata]|uniref:ubiquitinyl hydrolase 1 n=1 Tax=Babesia ovata TaxID=189622 RepID=A0A2H6KDB7_9APIC|nr:ubiquitin carboxyl-terminal hydrolase [Babesia ovata]GBE60981.1 ubiquitin carboxyl-terminal hydrolase [Babesia ovata]
MPARDSTAAGTGPSGLENTYNNCYCNAVLQALYPIHAFRDRVVRLSQAEAEISSALGQLYERCTGLNGVQSPKKLLQKICKQNEYFVLGDQQDAHEFLTYLINTMMDEIKALNKGDEPKSGAGKDSSGHVGGDGGTGNNRDRSGKRRTPSVASPKQQKPERTWLSRLVEGSLKSETTCDSCSTVTGTLEPFLTLSVDIFENCDISSCIQEYCAPERLTGKNQFYCDNCRAYTDASKRVVFENLPPIFIVHLKRFRFTAISPNTSYSVLYDSFERLPYSVTSNRMVTLQSRTQRTPVVYELFAVVNHVGTSPSYGHYNAITEVDGRWYCCDDSSTVRVSDVSDELGDEQSSGNPNSYILFYRMKALAASRL